MSRQALKEMRSIYFFLILSFIFTLCQMDSPGHCDISEIRQAHCFMQPRAGTHPFGCVRTQSCAPCLRVLSTPALATPRTFCAAEGFL